MKIEEIVKEYREAHGLSQRQFAAQCGLSPSYFWYLEQGINPQTGKRISPSIPALNKIARAMGLTFDELMNKCDNMLVALNDKEDLNNIFLALFSRLNDTQKEAVIAVMRGMVD